MSFVVLQEGSACEGDDLEYGDAQGEHIGAVVVAIPARGDAHPGGDSLGARQVHGWRAHDVCMSMCVSER